MTYEEFREKARNGMHETIYSDSDGREILVIKMLDAYALLTRPWADLTNPERADCWDTIPELAMRKVETKLKEKNT